MLIPWDLDFFEVLSAFEGIYSLIIEGFFKNGGSPCCFTNVYVPNHYSLRDDLWEELYAIRGMWHVLPWELCGDFNVARRREEKKNCRRTSLSMLDFNDFIIFHELIDLPLKGSRFTWTSGEDNPILCRLDRFLITPDFEQKFPLSTQTALSRPISDHLPLILDTVDASLGPSPFRFEAMWFLVPGFLEKFQAWWNSLTFSRSPSSTLWFKLEALKKILSKWNREDLGNLTTFQ